MAGGFFGLGDQITNGRYHHYYHHYFHHIFSEIPYPQLYFLQKHKCEVVYIIQTLTRQSSDIFFNILRLVGHEAFILNSRNFGVKT